MAPKVSVIIPVYNAENYVSACLASLLRQTLAACEFIFVNDGSSDRSRAIVETHMESDNRIVLVNQSNRGVSAARNAGLQLARGEYVGFVDADDEVEDDMFEILYRAAVLHDCDVAVSNLEVAVEGVRRVVEVPFPMGKVLGQAWIRRELLPYFLKSDHLNAVWNKLYRRSVISRHRVRFPEGMALGEDGVFNMEMFRAASSTLFLPYTGYHYRETAGSATRNMLEKDYFRRSLELYLGEPGKAIADVLDAGEIRQLKSFKLMNSVISYIHMYFRPSKEVRFQRRYQYVKRMIRNPYVRETLPYYENEVFHSLGRYDRVIIALIKRRSAIGLFCATAYSRFRNKSQAGG